MVTRARKRAAKSGVAFDIVAADVLAVWPRDGRCPALGISLATSPGRRGAPTSASLDRIDSSKGYLKDNIAVISARANTIKSFGTAEEHEKIAKWMRAKAQQKRKGA